MKDLFSGAAGRINHHGGSRIFTTPNTHNVPPDYLVDTDVPKVAEYVTCSLDGRLWAFRRSRRFYVVALRYDEFTQELVAASTIVLNNANFIARGVDWLLTDTTIVQASDNEPYVFTANIFNDSETNFLYSVLRSKEFASGIDPITKQAWGLSETNGNSEGYGYFNRSALLQSVSKHYSLLPAVGDWHIIKNFLVRKVDNPLTDAHNSMLNIRPLIPLEFNGSTPAYGCGFDNDIFITCYNGELWARGLHHIGRCYILPAVFDESGNPQEFYLYISPDFPRISLTQADKLNLGILKTDDSLYGFLPSQQNSLDNGLCFRSDNPKIFEPSSKQWQQISESGQMFIDTLNHSGLVLNNDGAIFLNGDSYQCKGLRQWLAPAGVVDAISAQSVISSFDNHALATYPQQEFFREALAGKKLPLSASAYSGKRFSLGCADADSVKSIQVNSITANNGAEAIAWENVYKQAVEIKLLNYSSIKILDWFRTYPIFVCSKVIGGNFLSDELIEDGYQFKGKLSYEVPDPYGGKIREEEIVVPGGVFLGANFDAEGMFTGYSLPYHTYNVYISLFYIHPNSGNFEPFTLSTRFINSKYTFTNGTIFFSDRNESLKFDIPSVLDIENGYIGIKYEHIEVEMTPHGDWTSYWPLAHTTKVDTTLFKPLASIPQEVINWQNNSSGNLPLQNILIPKNIPQNVTRSASAVFSEKYSNAKFLCDIPSAFKSTNGNISGALAGVDNPYWQNLNYWNVNSRSDDEAYCTQGLHVALASNEDGYYEKFFVFRSELHPDIFDFKFETQRS